MSKAIKEVREGAVWGSGGREFQAEGTTSAEALRWAHDGHVQGRARAPVWSRWEVKTERYQRPHRYCKFFIFYSA